MTNRRNFLKQATTVTAGSALGAHQLKGAGQVFRAAPVNDTISLDPNYLKSCLCNLGSRWVQRNPQWKEPGITEPMTGVKTLFPV